MEVLRSFLTETVINLSKILLFAEESHISERKMRKLETLETLYPKVVAEY